VAGGAVNYHRRVIRISAELAIADDEARFVASRSV
jgi:hypothetical protein